MISQATKRHHTTLARNNDQATAFEFRGTPAFIVGKFRVPGVLTMAQFDPGHCRRKKSGRGKEVTPSAAIVGVKRHITSTTGGSSLHGRVSFTAFQSAEATSQLTMVRLTDAL